MSQSWSQCSEQGSEQAETILSGLFELSIVSKGSLPKKTLDIMNLALFPLGKSKVVKIGHTLYTLPP